MGSGEHGRTLMALGEQRTEVSEPGGRKGESKAIVFTELSFWVMDMGGRGGSWVYFTDLSTFMDVLNCS